MTHVNKQNIFTMLFYTATKILLLLIIKSRIKKIAEGVSLYLRA
jgi:hypothetical protein